MNKHKSGKQASTSAKSNQIRREREQVERTVVAYEKAAKNHSQQVHAYLQALVSCPVS
jgi:hypothetical protein